jgi:hypothetical protein
MFRSSTTRICHHRGLYRILHYPPHYPYPKWHHEKSGLRYRRPSLFRPRGWTAGYRCAVDRGMCIITSCLDLTEQGTLFWTKPGSAHFHSNGVTKNVRLGQVGNWAGCNALGVCVGMSQSLINDMSDEQVYIDWELRVSSSSSLP